MFIYTWVTADMLVDFDLMSWSKLDRNVHLELGINSMSFPHCSDYISSVLIRQDLRVTIFVISSMPSRAHVIVLFKIIVNSY